MESVPGSLRFIFQLLLQHLPLVIWSYLKLNMLRHSSVVQWVKDLALSLQGLKSLLWPEFHPWLGKFYMSWACPPKNLICWNLSFPFSVSPPHHQSYFSSSFLVPVNNTTTHTIAQGNPSAFIYSPPALHLMSYLPLPKCTPTPPTPFHLLTID